jgi:hypothetical protein
MTSAMALSGRLGIPSGLSPHGIARLSVSQKANVRRADTSVESLRPTFERLLRRGTWPVFEGEREFPAGDFGRLEIEFKHFSRSL